MRETNDVVELYRQVMEHRLEGLADIIRAKLSDKPLETERDKGAHNALMDVLGLLTGMGDGIKRLCDPRRDDE